MEAKIIAITPDMIEKDAEMLSTFGQREPELAAESIIKFCQLLGGWFPFTQQQVKRVFFDNNPTKGFSDFDDYFLTLVEGGFVTKIDGEHYQVSDIFVRRCFAKHPARSSFFAE